MPLRARTALSALLVSIHVAPVPLLAQPRTAPDTVDVFFLGNSYVYYNNLPDQLAQISQALEGPVIRVGHHLHGGFTLIRHLDDGHLPGALETPAADGNTWDVVVVQEHSRLGVPYSDEARGTIGDPASFFRGASGVAEMVAALGSDMVFYMTWAKEAFPEQTGALARAYVEAARRHDAAVAPAGLAWERIRAERPDIVLFHPDGSHPSPAGTYLNACIVYAVITGQSPVGAPSELHGLEMRTPGVVIGRDPVPLVRLPEELAGYLQRVAWDVVSEGRG